jgi:hypothetical protein
MMDSITRILPTHGSQFGVAVASTDEVSATAPDNGELKLPGGSRVSLLAELPVAKNPEDRAELQDLISASFSLDERIKKFVLANDA